MSVMRLLLDRLVTSSKPSNTAAPIHSANPLIDYLEANADGRVLHRWLHYFSIYHRHFARFRGQAITVVEIGVFNGGSLRMWRDYFGQQATIVGVDVNAECERFAEPGIDIVIGDQSDRVFLRKLANDYPNIGILIDDGGHRMNQQIATFEELYPRLNAEAVYLCEDVHTSYLPLFGGGYRRPHTFVEYGKTLIDKLNAYHSQNHSELAPDEFTRTTDALHFYDGIVVIDKQSHPPPKEGVFGRLEEFRYVGPSLSGR